MWKFLFKCFGFVVLAFTIGACMSISGFGSAEQNSDFVNFVPWAASFFLVFFIPSMLKKVQK